MDISPNDLRTYEFPVVLRGYDRQEVRNLLEQAAAALEKTKQESLRLSMELDSIRTQLAGLRQFEDSIKDAAIDARRNADSTIANAKREAELILNKARGEAEEAFGSRASRLGELENRIAALETVYTEYQSKMRALMQSHLHMIDNSGLDAPARPTPPSFSSDYRQSEPEPLMVTDSEDITSKSRETFASQPPTSVPVYREESNAPDRIIAKPQDYIAPHREERAESEPKSESGMDPELAAALEQYTARTGKIPIFPSGVTTVAANATQKIMASSGKLQTADNYSSTQSFEPSRVSVDTPVETSSGGSLNPDRLAEELDRVVAKFEEEMNKAEHS